MISPNFPPTRVLPKECQASSLLCELLQLRMHSHNGALMHIHQFSQAFPLKKLSKGYSSVRYVAHKDHVSEGNSRFEFIGSSIGHRKLRVNIKQTVDIVKT